MALLACPLALSTPTLPSRQHARRSWRCSRARRLEVAAWNRQNGNTVAVPTTPVPEPPAKTDVSLSLVVGVAAAAAAIAWDRFRRRSSSEAQAPDGASSMGLFPPGQVRRHQSESEAKEYRMALSRTRQATAVHRALGFMKAGSSTRAMVELRRALHENSVCRSPLLNAGHSKAELESLYRLHLQETEVPADFATLLQLRSMLDLGFDEAENIEAEVMQQGAAYSI